MASILETYFTSLKDKNIVVLGLGVSNRPLVRLLLHSIIRSSVKTLQR